jgi:hypothetical protein
MNVEYYECLGNYRIELNLKHLEAILLQCVILILERFWCSLRWRQWTDFKGVDLRKSNRTMCSILSHIVGVCRRIAAEDHSKPVPTPRVSTVDSCTAHIDLISKE